MLKNIFLLFFTLWLQSQFHGTKTSAPSRAVQQGRVLPYGRESFPSWKVFPGAGWPSLRGLLRGVLAAGKARLQHPRSFLHWSWDYEGASKLPLTRHMVHWKFQVPAVENALPSLQAAIHCGYYLCHQMARAFRSKCEEAPKTLFD